jgi:excisionase family DNA binding protein
MATATVPAGDRLLSRAEAAAYLGLRPQTLASWAVSGRYSLPFVKAGRLARYRLSDLERFAERRTVCRGGAEEER